MFFYFLQILKTKKIEIKEEFEGFCYLLGLLDIVSYLYLLEYDLLLEIDLSLLEEIYNKFNFCGTLSYYINDFDTIIKNSKLFSFLEKVFKRWKKEKELYLSIVLNSLMVTHDREVALNSERVVELVDGKICKSFLIKEVGIERSKKILEDRTCKMED